MVGHLKCTVRAVYIKPFESQKGGLSELPQPLPPSIPAYGGAWYQFFFSLDLAGCMHKLCRVGEHQHRLEL